MCVETILKFAFFPSALTLYSFMSCSESQAAPFGPPRSVEDPQQPPPAAVLERVKACVADTGDTASRFDRLKTSVDGPMYVFRVDGPRRCPYGNHHDGSNNFCVLVRKRALLYWCNSAECQGLRPLQKIGELTRSEAMIGGEVGAFRADDVSAISGLHKGFVDHWAFDGDVGGSKIAAAMYTSCGRWAKLRQSRAYIGPSSNLIYTISP